MYCWYFSAIYIQLSLYASVFIDTTIIAEYKWVF